MRFLLNRKLVVPMLFATGLLVAFGGDVDAGAWIDAVGVGYWLISGWIMNVHRQRIASRHVSQFTAQVTAMSSRSEKSDGTGGAFSRLDPEWQSWLRREVDTR